MGEHFDPYHKWLGIPPRDQPPHHYRLLSIEPFESDPEVIDGAAQRLAAYVKSCAAGPHQAEARKLLTEIVAARHCLLDSQLRAAYDQTLAAPPTQAASPGATGTSAVRMRPGSPAANKRASLATAMPLSAAPVAPHDTPRELLPHQTPRAKAPPASRPRVPLPPAPPVLIDTSVHGHSSGHARHADPAHHAHGKKPRRRADQRNKAPGWVVPLVLVCAIVALAVVGAVLMSQNGKAPLEERKTVRNSKRVDRSRDSDSPAGPPSAAPLSALTGAVKAVADNAEPDDETEDASFEAADGADGAPENLLQAIEQNVALSTFQKLIADGADTALKDELGRTALRLAVVKKRADLVKALLAAKASVNVADARGETPLMSAAQTGDAAILKQLLAAGANPNLQTATGGAGQGGISALHVAARHGKTAVAQLLIDAGARADVASKAGVTPLMVAAWQGHAEIVRLLVDKGASLTAKDQEEQTPLMYAAEGGNPEVVQFLLDRGSHANEKSRRGTTALGAALERREPAVISKLRQAVKESAPVLDF